jgi:hypothetical protein
MATDDPRPPLWVGHVFLRTSDLPATRELMLRIGMRDIAHGPDFAVLELRGGTHLLLLPADEGANEPASFDLMVDDLDAFHARLCGLGLAPSAIRDGSVHRSFTLRSPSGHDLTFNSSHVSALPV